MSTAQAPPNEAQVSADPSSVELAANPIGSPSLFSSEDFERILEAEVLPDEARVELWDGRIYRKMAKTQAHAVSAIKLSMALYRALPPGWCLSHENPIVVGPDKVPLPDLVALRGLPDDYNGRRPNPADIGLIVEVAVTSLKADLGPRHAAYAGAGVPACWVIDPGAGVIHVHTTPIPAERRYGSIATLKPGDSISLVLDGVALAPIAASDILPAH